MVGVVILVMVPPFCIQCIMLGEKVKDRKCPFSVSVVGIVNIRLVTVKFTCDPLNKVVHIVVSFDLFKEVSDDFFDNVECVAIVDSVV